MERELDLIVIGWGKGGKTLAGTAARAGQRVAIVEASADMYGGTCINIGCIPTKALIHDADIRTGTGFDPGYFDTAVQRRDKLTAAMRAKNFSMLDDLDSVMTITGKASFIGPHRIRVEAGEETLELGAKRIIINTGAVPAIPDLDGVRIGGRVHDSTSLQHAQLPKSLVVVGGGYVGTEFASMFAHFGSKVTVLDRGHRALKKEDEDVAPRSSVRWPTWASMSGWVPACSASARTRSPRGCITKKTEQCMKSRPRPCSSPSGAPRPPMG